MNTRLIILRGNFEIDNKFVTSKQSHVNSPSKDGLFSWLWFHGARTRSFAKQKWFGGISEARLSFMVGKNV